MSKEPSVWSILIPIGLMVITAVLGIYTYSDLTDMHRQQALDEGQDLGAIQDISTGEEYCVVEVEDGSKYSISSILRCEELETGQLLYRSPDDVKKMPFGKKFYIFTKEEVEEGSINE